MARLLVHLERAELVEAQAAARTLLAHPLVTGTFPDPRALALVRAHEEPLREELLRLLGYRLEVGGSWARLVRRPSRLCPDRPALTRSGRRFSRRSYATLCLVLAALEQLGAAMLVSSLVDEVNRQAAGEALQASLVEHVERLIAVRRGTTEPARRHVVAEMCADILRSVMDDISGKPAEERAALVAELKLVLTSYLTVALPRI